MRFAVVALLLSPIPAFAQPELPRVLLVGDSIRLGYAPLVAKKLAGVAVVVSPKDNAADTSATLAKLDEWTKEKPFAVIHWNNGLHDLKKLKAGGAYQVPVEKYAANLTALAERMKALAPHVVFATTTPILDERHAKRKANLDRFDADVKRYNDAALETLLPLGIPVHDLNRIVRENEPDKMLLADGTHYTPAGYDRLADGVADVIRRQLTIAAIKPRADAVVAPDVYRKTEADLDAVVPEPFRSVKLPAFDVPKTADEWTKRRPDVLAKVVASLGDMPPRPKPSARLVSIEHRPGFRLERLSVPNGMGEEFSAMLLVPEGRKGPVPAVLWLHSSSYDHTQLLAPNTNGGEEPLGVTFVKRGWVVFAPDAAWYGQRAGRGPGGPGESTTNQQMSQAKFHQWFGRTLWGMFVRDDQVALDYLCSRPEVDAKRIAATGISMGSTRSWWLAAVDDRVKCVAGVACLTRAENLIRHGQLKQHGVYYFPHGLLKHFDTEAVVSLIAPRPALFLTGDQDAGSPADGIRVIAEKAGGVYKATGATDRFRSELYPGVGHTYTPTMRAEFLAWFDRWLK